MHQSELGKRLRQRREAPGLTQQAVADALGCTKQNVSQMEAGLTHPPLRQLARWAETLKMELRVLVWARGDPRADIHARLGVLLPSVPDEVVRPLVALLELWEAQYGGDLDS